MSQSQNSLRIGGGTPGKKLCGIAPRLSPRLSGTESAILNRESGDSESCDSNREVPRSALSIVRMRFGWRF